MHAKSSSGLASQLQVTYSKRMCFRLLYEWFCKVCFLCCPKAVSNPVSSYWCMTRYLSWIIVLGFAIPPHYNYLRERRRGQRTEPLYSGPVPTHEQPTDGYDSRLISHMSQNRSRFNGQS